MSSLAVRFAVRMCKRVVGSEGGTTYILYRKRSKRSSPDGEASKDWAIISVDSLDRASND